MSCVGDCGGLDTGRDGALDSEQGRGPGPVVGSGPDTVTPESLNNAQRAAGPIGPGRVKAHAAGQGKLVRRKEKSRRRFARATVTDGREREAHIPA